MVLNLNQHLLGHTAARQGYIFAQQEIDVYELHNLTLEVTTEQRLDVEVVAEPHLTAEIKCD